MTKGELFKHWFRVDPCAAGFTVETDERKTYAFTNLNDLVRWMYDHARALDSGKVIDIKADTADLKAKLKAKHANKDGNGVDPLPLPGGDKPAKSSRFMRAFGL